MPLNPHPERVTDRLSDRCHGNSIAAACYILPLGKLYFCPAFCLSIISRKQALPLQTPLKLVRFGQ